MAALTLGVKRVIDAKKLRAELLLLLQWWMRDIWLGSLQLSGSEPALPALNEATARLAERISADQASENLRALEDLLDLVRE